MKYRFALGQSTCFIDDEGVNCAQLFQCGCVFEQHALLCRAPCCHHDRHLVAVLLAYDELEHHESLYLDLFVHPEADRRRIRDIAKAHPEVLGFHDLRTRFSGSGYIVQFHLELDAGTSLHDTHQTLDQVEAEIWKVYPDCEIIIHPDPLGFAERRDTFEKPPAILASTGR